MPAWIILAGCVSAPSIAVVTNPGRAAFAPEAASPKQAPPLPTGNLIVNDDFKESWTVGWQRYLEEGTPGSNHVKTQNRGNTTFLQIIHSGKAAFVLFQPVRVQNRNLLMTASFKLKGWEGTGMYGFTKSGTAMIELQYLDESERRLGSTRILNYAKHMFADTPLIGVPRLQEDDSTTHHIVVEPRWHIGYQLDIQKEIRSNLPGVDPNLVSMVLIALYVGGIDQTSRAEISVDQIRLEYKSGLAGKP